MTKIPLFPVFDFEKEIDEQRRNDSEQLNLSYDLVQDQSRKVEPPKPKEMEISPINIYEGDTDYSVYEEYHNSIELWDINENLDGFISTFPGCCGYGVYHNLPITLESIQIATNFLQSILEENGRGDGFGSIIATIADDVKLQRFQDCGWKLINEHENPLSGRIIYTVILQS